MRLHSRCSSDPTGANNSAVTSFLMFAHIISTMLLTMTNSADAASIATITNKYTYRSKIRFTREVSEGGTDKALKEKVGERNCTESENLKQGCLAGSCTALVTSQFHTFIICKCPSNRQGARCEEIAINTDRIAEELQKDELCELERYDVLASFGYESLFFRDCVTKNYPNLNLDDKKQRRAKLKKIREKARRRKLRKRERKRNKKKNMRSSEKSSIFKEDIETRDNLEQNINTPDHLLIKEDEFNKKSKDHSGHNHKVRHESEKSSNRRRRKSLTTFLVGTPTATSASTPTTSTTRYIRPSR